jgi:hypothetical protein
MAKKTSPKSKTDTLPADARATTERVRQVLEAGEGILRLAPTWVPRSFLMPGRRIKLAPQDVYALGAHRGGIDERWFGSTTPAANDNREIDEGYSYVVHGGRKAFTLKKAIEEFGERIVGPAIWKKYQRWPVYSKFFDNLGPIPHHMHQNNEQAAKVGQQGKPESYYFPPQLNAIGNNFPYTFFGLEPGTKKEDIVECLRRWNKGDNGILNYSKAYRLQPGTGWLVPPCVLHAPGSLVTYEPQWGSDVFGMYQSMVEGRAVPWGLLVKDMPRDKHKDLEYLVEQLDWAGNVNPKFKDSHYLEPIVHAGGADGAGFVDKWIVYGEVAGEQLFSAKELTIEPGQTVTIKDNGAYGLIAVQGTGKVGKHALQTPAMIRYGELTEDEYFVSHEAAAQGVAFQNTGTEPLVTLRYFGPAVNPEAPKVGDHKKKK